MTPLPGRTILPSGGRRRPGKGIEPRCVARATEKIRQEEKGRIAVDAERIGGSPPGVALAMSASLDRLVG